MIIRAWLIFWGFRPEYVSFKYNNNDIKTISDLYSIQARYHAASQGIEDLSAKSLALYPSLFWKMNTLLRSLRKRHAKSQDPNKNPVN